MKLIGVDYGRRRTGISVTDETGTIVRGLATIDRNRRKDLKAALLEVIIKVRPEGLVFGVPLDADDRGTAMSAEIKNFAATMKEAAGLPVYFVDESMTSKRAAELLRFRKKKDRRNKAAVDRIAACLILEEFINENAIN